MRAGIMNGAAAGLVRALIARADVPRDRILLSDWVSTDWQSLTFTGQRHAMSLRIAPPDAAAVVDRMIDNLADTEFSIPGHLVIDVCVEGRPMAMRDGSIAIDIAALTIRDSD